MRAILIERFGDPAQVLRITAVLHGRVDAGQRVGRDADEELSIPNSFVWHRRIPSQYSGLDPLPQAGTFGVLQPLSSERSSRASRRPDA
jgi:hypothetical protein